MSSLKPDNLVPVERGVSSSLVPAQQLVRSMQSYVPPASQTLMAKSLYVAEKPKTNTKVQKKQSKSKKKKKKAESESEDEEP